MTAEPPKVDRVLCSNADCQAVLCERDRKTDAMVLTFWERHIPRPHTLTEADVPREWKCNLCGTVTTLAADIL